MDTKEFWNTRLSAHWGLQGVGYLALGRGFNMWMYAVRRAVFRRILAKFSQGGVACEIGPGTGFYTRELLKSGFRVTGVELSPFAVERLKEDFPQATFVQGNVADGLTGRYDLIVAIDVLFHILDDAEYARAFANMRKHLKPNGYLVFSENMPPERVAVKHQVSRSEQDVLNTLQRAGLKLVHRQPMFVLMNAPTKSGRTLWWKVLEKILGKFPWLGYFIGGGLFPLEIFLVSVKKTTPTTEFIVCRT